MSNILSKSPYIVSVGGTSVVGGLIEIYIWKYGSSCPSLPQYTLSKLTPALNVDTVYFDVAPYVNEYLSAKTYIINTSTVNVDANVNLYAKVLVNLYKLIGSTYTAIGNIQPYAFKGYLEQKDGINVDYGNYLLDQKTYYYHYDSSKTYTTLPAGDLTVFNTYTSSYNLRYKYTNLVTGATVTNTITETLDDEPKWKTIYRVYPTYWSAGKKLEIIDNDTSTVLATYYFKPKEECRYAPVTLDFINKYGAWQREFLFKNSTDSINVESQSYKNYRTTPNVYSEQENLVTSFNTNCNESIKTNTGWVNEDFKDNLKQILLSDRILINNRPATITTKQVDLQKNINNKLINYSLDFNFSNPLI